MRARKNAIGWLTAGDSNAILTERPGGPLECRQADIGCDIVGTPLALCLMS